jgi:hypothetical protein
MVQISQERCLELIEAIATEEFPVHRQPDYQNWLATFAVGRDILSLTGEQQATLGVAMQTWLWQSENHQRFPNYELSHEKRMHFGAIAIYWAMMQLLRQRLPFSGEDIKTLCVQFCKADDVYSFRLAPELLQAIERYFQTNPLTSEVQYYLEAMLGQLQGSDSMTRKYVMQIRTILQSKTGEMTLIVPGEAWADRALQEMSAISEAERTAWVQLVLACATTSSSKPSTKWLKTNQALVTQIGREQFTQALLRWLPLVDKPRTQPIEDWPGWATDPNLLLDDTNADILRGLVWLCAGEEHSDLAREIGKLAISAYRKVPGLGPRCVRLGNACVWALGQMPGQVGLAQLALLKAKVKFGTAQKGIETAFTAAAKRSGLSRSEIEELSVPAYGLEAVGKRQETLGDFTVALTVTGTSTAELRWFKADGKPQKSVPKAVKENYAEELRDLKQTVKDIQTMLPAQRDRIEALYLQAKTWDFGTWKARYLDHPLVGTLARRLIWQFVDGDRICEGIWQDGQLVNRNDETIQGLGNDTQVSLWHPITAALETIVAWRNWLLDHEVRQPFKQAHREIYLLTAAEERTRTYSNRFAAHILKQHQFNALCGQRGWKNQLRLMVDDICPPTTLQLPHWHLRAEFWVEGIGDDYGTDTTESGTYRYLTTDQVRFYGIDAADNYAHATGGGYFTTHHEATEIHTPLPLETIPALVFSEVMRDVDLFVGVASVGNDPQWADGGPEGRHYDYWYHYSFGDLSETARTRRQVLETLIPRLEIRDRCSFQDKFLVVRGDLCTYKIHLGSGNILMEPGDRYLCIVPGQGTSTAQSQLFLPFEGDNVMAIILSKAFLLAADTAITDPTILSQIQ